MKLVRQYDKGGLFHEFSPYIKPQPKSVKGSSSERGSSKDKGGPSIMDDKLYAELIKGGLMNDVNSFVDHVMEIEKDMARRKALNPFGDSSGVMSSLKYLSKVNELRRNKENYDTAVSIIKSNKTENEVAVGSSGEVFVKEGSEIKPISIDNYISNMSKYGPALTNSQLLNEREHNPNLAWNSSIFPIVQEAVSLENITSHIQTIVNMIGKESNEMSNVISRQYLESLTGVAATQKEYNALVGLYSAGSDFSKITSKTSTERNHLKEALNYIWKTLKPAAQNKLVVATKLNGTTPEELIGSALIFGSEHSESFAGQPLDKATSGSGSGGDKETTKPLTQFQSFFHNTFKGVWNDFMRNDPNAKTLFRGTIGASGPLVDKNDQPIRYARLSDLMTEYQYASLVNQDNMYFWNSKVSSADQDNFIINPSEDAGIIFMPVDVNTGAPDYNSLIRFNQANEVFEANKHRWDDKTIKEHFEKSGFNVKITTSEENGRQVRVLAESAHVKPFLVMSVFTNSDVPSATDGNDNSLLTRMTEEELTQWEPIIKSLWTYGQGKGATNMTPKGSWWKRTTYYKGVIAAPVKLEASVTADMLVKQGPLHTVPTEQQVKQNIKMSNQQYTGGLNPNTSSTNL